MSDKEKMPDLSASSNTAADRDKNLEDITQALRGLGLNTRGNASGQIAGNTTPQEHLEQAGNGSELDVNMGTVSYPVSRKRPANSELSSEVSKTLVETKEAKPVVNNAQKKDGR